ncbi:hypothetical protein JHK87_006874 [Glycine soja]|nr:hypothetical protein JHK87_006874 [Glycine soja]
MSGEDLAGADVLAFAPPWLGEGSGQGVTHHKLLLLEYLHDSELGSLCLPPTSVLCLKELYLLLYYSKLLLDYCAQSSKLWLLLQNHSISGHFHDLN